MKEARKREEEFVSKREEDLKQIGDLYIEIKELQTVKVEIEKQAEEYFGAIKVLQSKLDIKQESEHHQEQKQMIRISRLIFQILKIFDKNEVEHTNESLLNFENKLDRILERTKNLQGKFEIL